MTAEEIRIRQMTNQHLVHRTDMMTAVRGLCGVQAQFMTHALHALRIRADDADEAATAQCLVKGWTIRGTMHLFAPEDLPLFVSAKHYRSNDWHAPSFWNQRPCWALTPERQAYFTQVILDALAGGPQTREALKACCRAHGMTDAEEGSMFDPWGGGVREMCERGFMHALAQEEKSYCLAPAFTPVEEEAAQLELMRRYLTHFGPATIRDAAYFFGMPQRRVKQLMSELPVASASCGENTYFWLEQGLAYDEAVPDCVFLAGFDQLMLGYDKRESLYLLPEHVGRVFSRSGIVFPTVLLHGRIAGIWKQKNGRIQITPFASLTAADRAAVISAARQLWGETVQPEIL